MDVKNELKSIYANIIDLQKFAETKNAGIIAFNIVIIIGILSSYPHLIKLIHHCVLLFIIIFFFTSTFISILSQFPQTDNEIILNEKIEEPNIYYFIHLSYLSYDEFIKLIKKRDESYKIDDFDKDIINQILKISRITNYKFSSFKKSVYFALLGLVILFFFILIKLL